jgi:formylglycine-generating enzyme required for sulfatase activity
MALLRRAQGFYCVDRWEASLVRIGSDGRETPYPHNRTIDGIEDQLRAVSVAGKKPQGYVSGIQAERVCRRSKKRLCEVDEWVVACRGSALTRYPYGDRRQANVCNDRFKVLNHHPVPILFKKHAPPGTEAKLMWHPSWMNDPRLLEMAHTVVPVGSREACTNDYGVYDMVGNLHEWVDDPAGTFMGGFFMDTFQNGEGCEYRTVGHGFEYHDYSTGFRCCADPDYRPEPK